MGNGSWVGDWESGSGNREWEMGFGKWDLRKVKLGMGLGNAEFGKLGNGNWDMELGKSGIGSLGMGFGIAIGNVSKGTERKSKRSTCKGCKMKKYEMIRNELNAKGGGTRRDVVMGKM